MAQKTLGIIGVGAFGSLMARHLAPYFSIVFHDARKDLSALAQECHAKIGSLAEAASCQIIFIAIPVQELESVLKQIAPHIQPGALVLDVCSVKLKPTNLMLDILPKETDIVGTHPLFGPQSGKNGIATLNVAICNVRGNRIARVHSFLEHKLKLNVFEISAEEHDRQMAYVQGLTHLIAKVIVSLNLPPFQLKTKTFEYMESMVEMVRYDSDELFRAIERENPFSQEAKAAFFSAARRLEEKLAHKETNNPK